MALLNDIAKDYRIKLAELNISSAEAARRAGYKPQYVPSVMVGNIVTPGFLKLYEAMGYDVKIEYIPKSAE